MFKVLDVEEIGWLRVRILRGKGVLGLGFSRNRVFRVFEG